MTRFWNRAAV